MGRGRFIEKFNPVPVADVETIIVQSRSIKVKRTADNTTVEVKTKTKLKTVQRGNRNV